MEINFPSMYRDFVGVSPGCAIIFNKSPRFDSSERCYDQYRLGHHLPAIPRGPQDRHRGVAEAQPLGGVFQSHTWRNMSCTWKYELYSVFMVNNLGDNVV